MPTTLTNNAQKTAIARKKPSAPMRALAQKQLIQGRALDYGCGQGLDADTYGMTAYDPFYSPERPDGTFATVTCNFVLNVIEKESHRLTVIEDIQSYMEDDGTAYLTVRTDKKALKGKTNTGTWQGYIELDLPVVQKGSGYRTYELKKQDNVTSAPATVWEK